MKKICFGLIILIFVSPQIKSQPIQTSPLKLTSPEGSIRTYQSRGLSGQNEAMCFSSSKLNSADLDTAKLLSDQPLKSPMGAVLRSAILPGWGQIYNEKYIKGLLVFSVNGAFAYAIYHHHNEWKETGSRTFQNKRNLFTWYFGVSYLLTLIDAYVDAYLFGFEKAVELAVPRNEQAPGFTRADAPKVYDVKQNAIGIRISIEL